MTEFEYFNREWLSKEIEDLLGRFARVSDAARDGKQAVTEDSVAYLEAKGALLLATTYANIMRALPND